MSAPLSIYVLIQQRIYKFHKLIYSLPPCVINSTEADDLCADGFLYGLSKGYDLITCGRIATMLAVAFKKAVNKSFNNLRL